VDLPCCAGVRFTAETGTELRDVL